MPDSFFGGLNQSYLFPALNELLDRSKQKKLVDELQGGLTQNVNIPPPTAQVPGQSGDATHLNLPPMSISGVPTQEQQPLTLDDPRVANAFAIFLAQGGDPNTLNAQLKLMQMRQGEFKTISPGETYGTVKGTKFTLQGTAKARPNEKMYVDANGQVHFVDTSNPQSIQSGGIAAPGGTIQGAKEVRLKEAAENAPTPIKGAIKVIGKDGTQQTLLPMWNKESKKWEMYNAGSPIPTANTQLTSATRTMVEMAPTVKYFVDKIKGEVQQNENNLGPAASRWREFKAGKIGLADPAFTGLRTNMGLLTTALMRMHVGARGGEYIMKHFQGLIDEGKQSPENLQAALDQINEYADQLIKEKGQAGAQSQQQTKSKFKVLKVE